MNEPLPGPDRQPPDARAPGAPEPTVEPGAAHKLQSLQQERDQLDEQLRRAMADVANMRRRQQKELDDSRRRILEGFAQELLPAIDSFRLALQSWDERGDHSDPTALIDGVRMVQTLLGGALERHGLQEIDADGKAFDPARHEAVAVETRRDVPAGRVLKVLQAGYMLGDRVLRHARVLVSGAPDPAKPQPNESN